jgi:outer membrane protein OmpA-like peptidoglycan-associated protein
MKHPIVSAARKHAVPQRSRRTPCFVEARVPRGTPGMDLRFLLVGLCAVLACTPAPRSELLVRVAEVSASPAAHDAQTWAPQASAHAHDLEQQAERAESDGDRATADALAEQALAAHEHAWVLTRVARAERRRLAAESDLNEQQRALGELQAQEQRLSAEAAALELRAQVVKNALPFGIHEPADKERQDARHKAAAALSMQGRLLCVAARLLGETASVKEPLARLDELDRRLDAGNAQKALETATELRSECLRVISNVRREHIGASGQSPAGAGSASPPPKPGVTTEDHPAWLPADVLLTELSEDGRAPARDERGVAVVLRGLFAADGTLNAAGRSSLEGLGRVAKAHPEFPVLLVGHTASPESHAVMDRQLGAVTSELTALGVSNLAAEDAGPRQPLLPPELPHARERNQRIELVFVAPGL